jgi:hypothetical protein
MSTIFGVDSTFYGSYQPLRLSASELHFAISNNTKMYVGSGGNVGIGTTSPSGKLQVLDAGGQFTTYDANGYTRFTAYEGSAQIGLFRSGSTAGGVYIGGNGNSFQIYTSDFGSTLLTILQSNGNVGIGTTSPDYKLQVNGGSAATYIGIKAAGTGNEVTFALTNINGDAFIGLAGGAGNIITGTAAGDLNINNRTGGKINLSTTSANAQLTINASGNVGVGTTSPGYPLVVYRGGGSVDTIVMDGSVGYNVGLGIYKGGSQKWAVYSSNIDTFNIYSTGLNRDVFSILSGSGNIGIGITTPVAYLDVRGAGNAGSSSLSLRGGNDSSTFTSNQITLGYDNTSNYRHAIKTRHHDGNYINAIDFYVWKYGTDAAGTIGTQHVMTLIQGGAGAADTGRVGIGTTAPAYKLDVNGNGRFSGNLISTGEIQAASFTDGIITMASAQINRTTGFVELQFAGSGGVRFFGNTAYPITFASGTGAATFSNALQVAGQQAASNYGGTGLNFDFTSGNVGRIASVKTTSGGSSLELHTYNTSGGDNNALVISNTGNVGIGTTSPSQKLEVTGVIRGEALNPYGSTDPASTSPYLFSPSLAALGIGMNGSEKVRINSSGNVGINETSPISMLHFSKQTTWGTSENRIININNTGTGGDINVAHNMGSITWYSGNSTPTAEIAAYRNTPASGNNIELRFITAQAGTPGTRMTISNVGNVGIGTTSPTELLHVTNGYILVGIDKGVKFDTSGASGHPELSVNSSAALSFKNTAGSTTVFIKNDGNVGIGTTDPGSTLEVAGYTLLKTATNEAHNWFPYIDGSVYISCVTGSSIFFRKYHPGSNVYFGAFNSSGNLGIGTTSASHLLEIKGSTPFYSVYNMSGEGGIKFRNDGGTSMWNFVHNNADGNFYFKEAVNSLVPLTLTYSTGRVGIGTTSPSFPVHIHNNVNNFKLNISTTDTGTGASIQLDSSAAGGKAWQIFSTGGTNGTVGGNNFAIRDGSGISPDANSYRFIINTNGNVGIGTTNPSNGLLQVNGRIYTVGTAGSANAIFQGGQLEFYKDSTPTYAASIGLSGPASGGTNDIVLNTYDGTWSERMRITSGGNVGIGTTSPSINGGGLEVGGRSQTGIRVSSTSGNKIEIGADSAWGYIQTLNTNQKLAIYAGAAQGPYMVIASDGNVGIGTTSPNNNLHINGNGAGFNFSGGNNRIYFNSSRAIEGNGTNLQIGEGHSTTYLQTSTNGIILTVTGANVGIGTTSPSSKFHVSGSGGRLVRIEGPSNQDNYLSIFSGGIEMFLDADTTNSSGIVGTQSGHNLILRTNGDNRVWVTTGGNVGIGTSSPVSRLDVSGTADTSGFASLTLRSGNSSDTFTSNQIRLGYGNTSDYSHAIKTRHHSGNFTNAFDFYVWRYGTDAPGTIGTQHVMTLTQGITGVDGGGRVGIGTQYPSYKLDVSGDIRATGDVIAYSDARVKENVNTITDALTKVTSLRGVSYTRNDSEDKSEKVGVIAQEVLPILPEVVQQDDKGNYSVAYGNIVGVLIEAIKEQQQQIDELKYLLQTINK